MTWARQRGVVLTLALLALALKVVVPPGYVVGTATNSLPFTIVICTAQGAVVVDPGASHEDEASKHDAPCVFAGHGLGAAPPAPASYLVRPSLAYHPIAQTPPCEATPGRGLCAPPPPARGPPLSI